MSQYKYTISPSNLRVKDVAEMATTSTSYSNGQAVKLLGQTDDELVMNELVEMANSLKSKNRKSQFLLTREYLQWKPDSEIKSTKGRPRKGATKTNQYIVRLNDENKLEVVLKLESSKEEQEPKEAVVKVEKAPKVRKAKKIEAKE